VAVLVDAARPSPFVDELSGEAPRHPAPAPPTRPGAVAATGGVTRERRGRQAARRDEGAAGGAGAPSGDPALEEALRLWRRERAGRDKVPAYIVFADRTLRAIASARPSSLAALRQVDGIGPTKLEMYGDDILAVIGEQTATAAAGPRSE
jgi:superfamily II DNA helicase RecQ